MSVGGHGFMAVGFDPITHSNSHHWSSCVPHHETANPYPASLGELRHIGIQSCRQWYRSVDKHPTGLNSSAPYLGNLEDLGGPLSDGGVKPAMEGVLEWPGVGRYQGQIQFAVFTFRQLVTS